MTIKESVAEARRLLDAKEELPSNLIALLVSDYEHHVAAQDCELVSDVLSSRDALYREFLRLRSLVFSLKRRLGLDPERVQALLDILGGIEERIDAFSDEFNPVDREFEARLETTFFAGREES